MFELDMIYNEDCLEGMKRIPDGAVDAIICDLPYEVLHKNNPNAQWDRMIPMEPLWEQYKRVIKDNGAILLFCQGMFTAQLMMSQPKLWRYNLVWDKCRTTSFLNANRMPLRCHEDIAVFYKRLPIYNPQMTAGKQNHPRGSEVHETNNCYGAFKRGRAYDYDKQIRKVEPTRPGEKFPVSIIRIKKEHETTVLHPTQKPVELIRYLIRTYSETGGVILDNCMGSGTTAIAAMREKRHFVGFELNREYFDKAVERINRERQQPALDFATD